MTPSPWLRKLVKFTSIPAAWKYSVWAAALTLGAMGALRANVPGGGTGTGANVTLVDNGNGTVTMGNGNISVLINKSTAFITQFNYLSNGTTTNVLANGYRGGELYWEWAPNSVAYTPANCTYTVVADPSANGGNYAEVDLLDTWNGNLTAFPTAWDVDVHYSLLRGANGIYCTVILNHPATYPATDIPTWDMIVYVGGMFNWISVDQARNRQMASPSSTSVPVAGAPQEVYLWTSGLYQGQYECKYSYSTDFSNVNVWGWSSVTNSTAGYTGTNLGIWMTLPSHEYYDGGALNLDLTCQQGPALLNVLNCAHYALGIDSGIAANETWTKVQGPFLIYVNSIPGNITDPLQAANALWADAQAQALAEQGAWPYPWFQNPWYVQASGRGTVTGRIVIADSGNPNASPAGLWVGVAQAPPSTISNTDFQEWTKNFQYWVKTDANGNFTIPHVIAGANYTLFAFGPGAIGTFQSQLLAGAAPPFTVTTPATPFGINVAGGQTVNLGNVTWTPPRVGPTVFEIGVPDRTAYEFRHGNDYWQGDVGPNPETPSPNWGKFMDYPTDFPGGGPVYTVGQSVWSTDWPYVQPAVPDGMGNFTGSTSKILFNLASAPAAGAQASLYLAIAADFQGPIIVTVNGNIISDPTTGYFPAYSSASLSNDAMERYGAHGGWSDNRITFSGSLLQQGQNEIDLNMRKGGYIGNSALYDYIRLELTGYVPPTPANLTAAPQAGSVTLSWTPVPGATGYTIQRATSPTGPFTTVAANVAGPVVGSGVPNPVYTDTGVTNGTMYYYTVSAANGGGNSTATAGAAAKPAQTFAQWIAAELPGQTAPQVIGPAANPAGDGLPNLLKYFLALNPATGQAPPTVVSVALDGHGNLVLSFPMAKNQTGTTYAIEESTDLQTWTNTGVQGSAVSDIGAYYLMQASVPMSGGTLLFLRLNVSLN